MDALWKCDEIIKQLSQPIPAFQDITAQYPASGHTRPPILRIVFPSPDALLVEVTSYIPVMAWYVESPIRIGLCEAVYEPAEITICATTLSRLGSKVPITECDQVVTFSIECGFTLETLTATVWNTSLIMPVPTIRGRMIYWIAPWQSLILDETPSDVDIKI
ncbi:hypothetical protein CC78DRAFT_616861 [Lojkania enalia]|uniref:Uncharacterized protein n=1 Tax=Lojkania enalia TaxID=147567 RepID=A0A9P4K9T0_9PLEO|nr:hypothetical protein CC78DRAFT_616861 [Didymosphaeria enalia]